MTPQFAKGMDRKTVEIYFNSGGDVLLDIPNNGLGGFRAIVKSCFIPKSLDTIKYCLNNIQSAQVGSGP